ncbi:hypothetical protein [uncultured Desulfobacter sp.]|uniref:hypothetical protein n=1 Tax=uncultured Desulfobacter sp. TaxID=240139 RepID=UPI002AAA888A|nr:hypothetical protein [uncultured Desulfobacter sp.]
MEQTPYKKLDLPHGHCLEIFDDSRKIGADAWVVIMTATMKIPVETSLFASEPLSDDKFNDILKALGSPIEYRYRLERNMIMDHEKDAVLENLVNTFLENTGKYVANSKFPAKLALKAYRDRVEKRKKK